MNNYIADKSTPTQLHEERSQVLTPVDNDLGSLTFEVSSKRGFDEADLVMWEKRGTRTWGIPVHRLAECTDAHAAAETLNTLVQNGILRAGPLLPTYDPVTPGLQADALRAVLEENNLRGWKVELFLQRPEEAMGLSRAFRSLLASRVVRFVPGEAPRRIPSGASIGTGIYRLADDDRIFTSILTDVCNASPKVDPKNQNQGAPLEVLDRAGVYGSDIEGLYQICGRHPGRMVAVLRAVPLGLIDAPAIQAALTPFGIVRGGRLDVDGITKAVEANVPEFSASRGHADYYPVPSVPKLTLVQPPHPGQGKEGLSGGAGHGGK